MEYFDSWATIRLAGFMPLPLREMMKFLGSILLYGGLTRHHTFEALRLEKCSFHGEI